MATGRSTSPRCGPHRQRRRRPVRSQSRRAGSLADRIGSSRAAANARSGALKWAARHPAAGAFIGAVVV